MATNPATGTPAGLNKNVNQVVVFGDTHMNIPAFTQVVLYAISIGASGLISVGDFGYLPATEEGRTFLAEVIRLTALHQLWLVVVDGNHDDLPALRALPLDTTGMGVVSEFVRYAGRGLHWNLSGVEFLAAGGATSIDAARRNQGIDWFPEENISFADTNRCIDAGPADVVISHESPDGVELKFGPKSSDLTSQANRAALRAIVEAVQPKLLIHGHHHRRATSTLVLASGSTLRVEGLGRDGSGEDLYLVLDLTGRGLYGL